MHETANPAHVSIHGWIDDGPEGLYRRTTAEDNGDIDSPAEDWELLLDAGLEVPEQVYCQVMLVDHIPLLVIQLSDALPKAPCESYHVGLGPEAADVLGNVA
ncbi:MAG: hypothetical protein A4E41_00701 [Methanoregulaceae archaeon PtaU1.Bin066]|nr:MAG: hypothetical protein A4E41_00701 [Methanoregulaceae archaeon PtaU1.Bin066]